MFRKIEVRTALATNFRDTSAFMFDPNFAEMMMVRRTDGPTITVGVPLGSTPVAIANEAWNIGNRASRDDNGVAWPSNVRSMSVGDMVIIDEVDGQRQDEHFTVAIVTNIGFRVETIKRVFEDSVSSPRSEQGERGPWADASDEVIEGMTMHEAEAVIDTARHAFNI